MITFQTNQLNEIPKTSGLYYFFENDKLLYVGKAKKLRWRVKQHDKNNEWLAKFTNILSAKIFPLLEKNDVTALLKYEKVIESCRLHCMPAQRIDLAFKRITKIEIEEIPYELTKQYEKEKIQKLQPPLNHETCKYDEVDDVINKCYDLGLILLQSAGW